MSGKFNQFFPEFHVSLTYIHKPLLGVFNYSVKKELLPGINGATSFASLRNTVKADFFLSAWLKDMGDWIAFVTCTLDAGEWLSSLLRFFTLVTAPPLSKRVVGLILTKWFTSIISQQFHLYKFHIKHLKSLRHVSIFFRSSSGSYVSPC